MLPIVVRALTHDIGICLSLVMTYGLRVAPDALDCLGSPTRRAVLQLLRDGERSVRELTDDLPVSQPAVSQHLAALREAGLVRVREDGARRLYSVDLGALGEVRAWVDSFWDDVLTAFADHLAAGQPPEPGTTTEPTTTETP